LVAPVLFVDVGLQPINNAPAPAAVRLAKR
jgi:hypothetical protein